MVRSLLAVGLGFVLMSLAPRLLFLIAHDPSDAVRLVYGACCGFVVGYLVALLARRLEITHASVLVVLLLPTDLIAFLLASGQPLAYLIGLAVAQIVAILAGAAVRASQARNARV
ncbi:MAG TPA: hypothetical protein VG204_14590 [Terriglobia bacterium]|nr:hypothetical protein [Terriglobia bacterium]